MQGSGKEKALHSLRRAPGAQELVVTAPYYLYERRDRHGNITDLRTFTPGDVPVVICEFPYGGLTDTRQIRIEPDGSLSEQLVASRRVLRGNPRPVRSGRVKHRFLDGLGFGTESVRPV